MLLWLSCEAPDRNGHGGQRRQFHEIRVLVEAGFTVVAMIVESSQSTKSVESLGCSVIRTSLPNRRYPIRRSRINRQRAEIIRSLQPDVVMFAHFDSYPLVSRRALPRGTPVVCDAQNVYSFQPGLGIRRVRVRWIEASALRRAHHVVVLSTADEKAIRRLNKRIGVKRWMNGVDLEEWVFPPSPSSEPIVSFFGSLWYPINCIALRWFLNEVWSHVRRDQPNAILRLIGPGEPPPDISSAPGVELRGWVERLDEEVASSRGLIVPYLGGPGAPVKFYEALASGLPVVCNYDLATEHGVQALVSPCLTAADFAAACIRVLRQDPELLERAGRARQHAENRLRWEVTGAETVLLLKELSC
jgi:polysaccharide biosynthesis protein PslH